MAGPFIQQPGSLTPFDTYAIEPELRLKLNTAMVIEALELSSSTGGENVFTRK